MADNYDYFRTIEAGQDADANWCPDCGEPRGVCRCYEDEPAGICPKCDSENIRCTGSDSVVNIGAPGDGLEHVSWWLCEDCGHRWVGD